MHLVLLIALSACSEADGGDQKKRIEKTKKLAAAGDAKAQNYLGLAYAKGYGVELDGAEAVKWYRKAADQGLTSAYVSLGYIYLKGNGVPINDAEAAKCLRKAADQGDGQAQVWLGDMYLKGRGVPKDDAEAVKLYRKAAEQGDKLYQSEFASLLEGEESVTLSKDIVMLNPALQDYAEAVKWYRKAAEQGHDNAQCKLSKMYLKGKGVPKDEVEAHAWFSVSIAQTGGVGRNPVDELLTPEARARAQQRATELFNKIEAGKRKTGK